MSNTNLQDFYDRCENFDWFYEMSDDGRVYRDGVAAHAKLKAEAVSDAEKMVIYVAWKDHYFSGLQFGTVKKERPVRP